MTRPMRVERMGMTAYGTMLGLQERRHCEVRDGDQDDTLFLLEHLPVITTGKNTGTGHILANADELSRRGVTHFETGRGGDVTYHGPGQIVGYPIVQLQDDERDIRRFVGCLEEVLIRTAADFGVKAERVQGLRGIWVGNDKLAAIGVRISRWTTMHGFALNVSTDLSGFDLIVPCGLHGRGVTSLQKLLGEAPPLGTVEDRLSSHAADVLGREAYEAEPTSLNALGRAEATMSHPATQPMEMGL